MKKLFILITLFSLIWGNVSDSYAQERKTTQSQSAKSVHKVNPQSQSAKSICKVNIVRPANNPV